MVFIKKLERLLRGDLVVLNECRLEQVLDLKVIFRRGLAKLAKKEVKAVQY